MFHIQTEDSGIRHPHIITHLFADGGRILKTTKTSYTEHIGLTNMADTVRAMMQEQHKAMFIALRDGQFDQLFEDSAANAARAAKQAASKAAALEAEKIEAAPLSQQAPVIPPAPPSEPFSQPAPISRGSRPRLDIDPALLHGGDGPPSRPAVTVAAESSDGAIDLDLDALERAAAEAQTPFFQQIHDLPPPPAAVLGKKPGPSSTVGSYSVTPQPARHHGHHPHSGSHAPPPAHASHDSGPLSKPRATPMPAAASVGARYAPSRPAAIFATTRPPDGASIFGEDLISEKSLDEVILSYLAEDLEGPVEKK